MGVLVSCLGFIYGLVKKALSRVNGGSVSPSNQADPGIEANSNSDSDGNVSSSSSSSSSISSSSSSRGSSSSTTTTITTSVIVDMQLVAVAPEREAASADKMLRPRFETLCSMVNDVGTRLVKHHVMQNLPKYTLRESLDHPKYKNKIFNAKTRGHLYPTQIEILYPRTGEFDERKIDLSLWCSLSKIFSNRSEFYRLKIEIIRKLRNTLCHPGSHLSELDFEGIWNEAECTLFALGANSVEIEKFRDRLRLSTDLILFLSHDETMFICNLSTDGGQSLKYMQRPGWRPNQQAGRLDHLWERLPQKYLVVSQFSYPDVPECGLTTRQICKKICEIQQYHMRNKGWYDIAYNFLIGDDGVIYEGRGWDWQGATAFGWNSHIFGFYFVGSKTPSRQALQAFQNFTTYLVRLGKLHKDFTTYGLRQVREPFPNKPSDELFSIMKSWPNWKEKCDSLVSVNVLKHDKKSSIL